MRRRFRARSSNEEVERRCLRPWLVLAGVAVTLALVGVGVAHADGNCGVDGGVGGSQEQPSEFPPDFNDPVRPPGPEWEWRGTGPVGSSEGAWYNPRTGESWHPDLGHPPPKGPHWDWNSPSGARYEWYPDGRFIHVG